MKPATPADIIEVLATWLKDLGYRKRPATAILHREEFSRQSDWRIDLCTPQGVILVFASSVDGVELLTPGDKSAKPYPINIHDPDCFSDLIDRFDI